MHQVSLNRNSIPKANYHHWKSPDWLLPTLPLQVGVIESRDWEEVFSWQAGQYGRRWCSKCPVPNSLGLYSYESALWIVPRTDGQPMKIFQDKSDIIPYTQPLTIIWLPHSGLTEFSKQFSKAVLCRVYYSNLTWIRSKHNSQWPDQFFLRKICS